MTNARRGFILGGAIVGGIVASGVASVATATEGSELDRDLEISTPPSTGTPAASGAFLPFSHVASMGNHRAWALGLVGYDSARAASTFEASTEVRLWGPVSLRGGAVYTDAGRKLRPSLGARVQALDEERHGVAGAVGVFYRPEGLTELEGEIETVLSVGRHMGGTFVLGNLLYGQDPEGNERDGEVRLAAIRPLASRFLFGFDGRLRFDIGSDAGKLARNHEARMDALVGPTATVLLGPIALSLYGGGSAVRLQQTTSYGAFTMVGLGTSL